MLKLTHSFYRFTKQTCENVNFNTTHVKRYSHLNGGRKSCVTLYALYSIKKSFTYTCPQLRLLLGIKKKHTLKKSQFTSSGARANNEMNKKLLPSVAYASQGGSSKDDTESSTDSSEERDSSDVASSDVIEFSDEDSSSSSSSYEPINKRREKIPINFRRWEKVAMRLPCETFRFKIVSYNMLAQYLLQCHAYLYQGCDPEDLSMAVRFKRIFKEIMDLNPDIVCLQEVQATHIMNYYVKFEQNGYYGIFKQKTGHRGDGVAIYFKKDLFDLVDYITVEYFQPELPILNRDNVGLIMKLIPRAFPSTPLVVATTHLLYNPKRTDVRLAQMRVLLAELDRFAYFDDPAREIKGYYPILLAGDFNSLPDSPVIKFLDVGKLCVHEHRKWWDWRSIGITDNSQHFTVQVNRSRGEPPDFSMIKIFNTDVLKHNLEDGGAAAVAACPPHLPTQREMEVMHHSHLFNSSLLRHPLKLASVYPRIKFTLKKEATTYQNDWVTVDYIYFSCCNKLRLIERLRLPTQKECEVLGHLPNDVYGSDHLVLGAHFEIRPQHGFWR